MVSKTCIIAHFNTCPYQQQITVNHFILTPILKTILLSITQTITMTSKAVFKSIIFSFYSISRDLLCCLSSFYLTATCCRPKVLTATLPSAVFISRAEGFPKLKTRVLSNLMDVFWKSYLECPYIGTLCNVSKIQRSVDI